MTASHATLNKTNCHPEEARNHGQLLSNRHVGTEAISPTAIEELKPGNNDVSLEMNSSPVVPLDEILDQTNTLIVASGRL